MSDRSIRTLADFEAQAAEFLAARRVWAGGLDLRMDATGDGGGSGDGGQGADGADEDDDETGDGGEGDGTEQLGDAGKKALDAMKARWKAERDQRKDLERQLAEAAKPADPSKKDPDDKPDLEALRKQARDEAAAETVRERALDRLEAKAARMFANPEDARLFLADKVDDFVDGKKIDNESIMDALKDLLTARPYLGVTQGEPQKKFQGGADQGDRGGAGKPQLTRADVERLAREGKHAEIETARIDGRLNKVLGIT